MAKLSFTARTAARRRLGWLGLIGGLGGLLLIGGFVAVNVQPALGAQAADTLRGLIGDQAVAELETVVYRAQDSAQQWVYQLGGAQPAAPWGTTPAATDQTGAGPAAASAATTARATAAAQSAPVITNIPFTPAAAALAAVTATEPAPAGTPTAAPAASPTATPPWSLAALTALGQLPGEGQWSAYLRDPGGEVVAYRTFLQPDPQRPYAVVAIVAFNLARLRLHFVLGSSEPRSAVVVDRPGTIPITDQMAGVLLATFNGGFKARQGHYGAMANGIVVLPARADLGAVALYTNGAVRIGAWGTDIGPSPDLLSWRQNGPLLIHQGKINPHTAEEAPWDWGYTLDGATAVWRSGLGLSPDQQVLYYAAGPHLVTSALTQAMAATGAAEALQLDINNYWVHFDAIQAAAGALQATPLMDTMAAGVGRWLKANPRDFFYVTALGQ